MSHTRRFSEVSEDFESSASSVGVFTNSRSSLGSATNGRESKRRKTSGLNSRFDRMVEVMNATHRSPIKTGRRRTRTVSSSTSVGTSDLPQTPLDAYSGLQEGRLGKDFAVIKMNNPSVAAGDVPNIENIDLEMAPNSGSSISSITKHLPEWLCNTFSTLTAKHPLRLLLPRKSASTPDSSTMTLPPGILEPLQGLAVPENDLVFAFSAPQSDEGSMGAPDVRRDLVSDILPGDLQSPYRSRNPLMLHVGDVSQFNFASPDDFSSVGSLPFSAPGSGSLVPRQTVSSPPPPSMSIYSADHAHATYTMYPPNVGQLDFVPFSTPGPGSTLSSAHDTAFMQPINFEASFEAPNDEHIARSLDFIPLTLPGPSHNSESKPPSSPRLSPSRASTSIFPDSSDPAPSHSSDDIPDGACYEDPLTDDSGSDPQPDHFLHTALDHPDVYATPAPAFRPPRPVYFDSPTEDPFDSDPLQPGYEIDYGALDFRWEPFDRKGGEDERTPNTGQEHQIYALPIQSENLTDNYADSVERYAFPVTPERIPSPSPFRFSPHSGDVTDPGSGAPGGQVIQDDDKHAPEESQQSPPVFAPAPGIFISPLRGLQVPESEPASPLSRTLLETLDKVNEQFRKQASKNKKTEEAPPNSQTSNDSIESWRDAVDTED